MAGKKCVGTGTDGVVVLLEGGFYHRIPYTASFTRNGFWNITDSQPHVTLTETPGLA